METDRVSLNPEKFKQFICDVEPKFVPYADEMAPKLINLIQEIPQGLDHNVKTDSGSITYDWFEDHINQVIYCELEGTGLMSTEEEDVDDDDIYDAIYMITDMLDLVYNNSRALLEKAIELMD